MLNKIKKIVSDESFSPSWIGVFLNPFFFSRRSLSEKIKLLAVNLSGNILDVGCGSKPYQSFFNSSNYVGLEVDSVENRLRKNADFFYNGVDFPFSDEEFDSVFCSQVLEHVKDSNFFIQEINRVLKKNGVLLLSVPLTWDEHEQPNDFLRYTSFGLSEFLASNGFEIVRLERTCADVTAIFQLWSAYLYKITFTKITYLNVLISIFVISPFNILGFILNLFLPKNSDFYLDNIVLAVKK